MKTKKFSITFEFDEERTHWLFNDSDQAQVLERIGHSVATMHSSGALPVVSVAIEPEAEILPFPAA